MFDIIRAAECRRCSVQFILEDTVSGRIVYRKWSDVTGSGRIEYRKWSDVTGSGRIE